MVKLETVLQRVFPSGSFLKGLSITGRGLTFSIRKEQSEKACGVDLDRCEDCWPPDEKLADGLFVGLPDNRDSFLVVVVELKKRSKDDEAIKQLANTAALLCSKGKSTRNPHEETTKGMLTQLCKGGHGGKPLGVVVTGKSIPTNVIDKARAKSRVDFKIKSFTTRKCVKSLQELAQLAGAD